MSQNSLSAPWQATVKPGPLERLPAGLKFIALFVTSILTYLIPWMTVQVGLLVLALLVALLPRVPLIRLVKALIWVVIIVGLVVAVMVWQENLVRGLHYGTRLVTVVLLAYAVTASTTFPQMLRVFQKGLSPLRFIGVNTEVVSMAMALTVRFIPQLGDIYREIREAQAARGLQRSTLALLVPLMIRTLHTSEHVADALDARSFNTGN